MIESFSNAEQILAILRAAARPLSIAQILSKIPAGQKPGVYEGTVAGELRRLRGQGKVLLKSSLWAIPPENPPTISTSPGVGWSPSKSSYFRSQGDGSAASAERRSSPGSAITNTEDFPTGPWSTFRKLLMYYHDCVASESGAEALENVEDIGEKYFLFSPVGDWYPTAGVRWTHRFPLTPGLEALAQHATEDESLILGYPLHVWLHNEGAVVKPIFYYRLKARINGPFIEVDSNKPMAEVNVDWLRYAIRKNRQRTFLAACGMVQTWSDEDDWSDEFTGGEAPSLRSLTRTLSTFQAETLIEPLDPNRINSKVWPKRIGSGIYNRVGIFRGRRTVYTRTLLRELRQIRNFSDEQLDTTALRFFFRGERLLNGQQAAPIANTHELNGEQEQAVGALLSAPVSVITGPPGTGKSQVVCAALVNSRLVGRTALFTSKNHRAVSAVVDRLNPEQRLIVRANQKNAEDRFDFSSAVRELLGDAFDPSAQEKWFESSAILIDLMRRRSILAANISEVDDLKYRLGEVADRCKTLVEMLPAGVIASLEKKAMRAFPFRTVSDVVQELAASTGTECPNLIERFLLYLAAGVDLFIEQRIPALSGLLTSGLGRRAYANSLIAHDLRQVTRYIRYVRHARSLEALIQSQPELGALRADFCAVSDKLTALLGKVIPADVERRRGLSPEAPRDRLASLRSALSLRKQRSANETERSGATAELNVNASLILDHYPVWAVTSLSLGSLVPLVPGLFDLLVVDEASQSDIASAIPALFRAKRAGIVGDPKQLTHSSSLRGDRDLQLRRRHGLHDVTTEQRFGFADTSLYDLASQIPGVAPITLRDTFRSAEEIANYSNSVFYGGNLRVMTAAERLKAPKGIKPGILWRDVVSAITPASQGCSAPDEASEVVALLKDLLVNLNFEGTVGVVTPFNAQKKRILDQLETALPREILERAALTVDTAHGFQGGERDVMIFSVVAGPGMPGGARSFLERTANLFNVAVSRARAVLYIVGNKNWIENCDVPHLRALTAERGGSAKMPVSAGKWHPHESYWEKVLSDALCAAGIETVPQHPVIGRRLDLAVVDESRNFRLDIEVDGDRHHRNPDGSRRRDDLWRDIQLSAQGWRIRRFWVYQLREDLLWCVEKVKEDCAK